MGSGHDHVIPTTQNEKYIWIALILSSVFLVVELIGSVITGSLALLSDAAHMLTDVSALMVSLASIYIAKRASDLKRTFGYHRFEILAAAFNAILLFIVAIYILYEAYQRLKSPPELQSTGMLIIASIGLGINLLSMKLLSSGKDSSLNIKSAYLEVWSDALGSVGVIVAALLIRWTGLVWIDSAIAAAIGIWVLPRTWILLKETINILLEGVPEGIHINELKKDLCKTAGVVSIHELHVWAITSGKISLTAHIVIDKMENCENILSNIRKLLIEQHHITHTTLQCELTSCANQDIVCNI